MSDLIHQLAEINALLTNTSTDDDTRDELEELAYELQQRIDREEMMEELVAAVYDEAKIQENS